MGRRVLLCAALLVVLRSECLAGDPDTGYGTQIAVEFKVDNKPCKPPMVHGLTYFPKKESPNKPSGGDGQ